jgi:hypothetical protein
MEQRTFEGTWEEVIRHAPELAGRRVRVTVLDAPGRPATLDRALAALIRDAEVLAGELRPAPVQVSADAWAEGVAEKFRRQGFSL